MKSSYSTISKAVLYVLACVIVVSFAIGWFVGPTMVYEMTDENGAVINSIKYPALLDLILWLCYALVIITFVVAIGFGTVGLFRKIKEDAAEAFKGLAPVLMVIVTAGIAYLFSSSDPVLVEGQPLVDSDGQPVSKFWYMTTDLMIIMQYVLLLVTVLCAILCPIIFSFRRSL